MPPAQTPSTLRFLSTAQSDVGRKRARNEDSFLCDDALGVWLVADGMGGHSDGHIASRETAEAVHGEFQRDKQSLPPAEFDEPATSQRVVERAVQTATYFVFGMAELSNNRGMGTTLSGLFLAGGHLVSAQVGDSRIYRIRRGEISLLTEDHTLVNWQLQRGLISETQARRSRRKNVITRAVGHRDYVQVDTACWQPAVEDRFVLCSDGLHQYLGEAELLELAAPTTGAKRAVGAMIDFANEQGGTDNITAVVLDVGTADPDVA